MKTDHIQNSENKSLVSAKNSITTKPLGTVFSIYLIITVVLTATHMTIDFFESKDNIYQELANISESYSSALSKAVWNLDKDETKSITEGISQSNNVIGILLEDESKNIIGATGSIFINQIETTFNQEPIKIATPIKTTNIFTYRIPLFITSHKDQGHVGSLTLYSSNIIAFNNIKIGFTLIIINAVIKTFALWTLFLWVSRGMLSIPLKKLSYAMDKVKKDQLSNLKINLNIKGRNELTILEEGFNTMVKNLLEVRKNLQNSNDRLEPLLKGIQDLSFARSRFIAMALITQNINQLFYKNNIRKIEFGFHETKEDKNTDIIIFNYMINFDKNEIDLLNTDHYQVSHHHFFPDLIKKLEGTTSTYIEDTEKLILLPRKYINLSGFIIVNGTLIEEFSIEDKQYITTLVKSLTITLDNISNTESLEFQISQRTKILKDTLNKLEEEHQILKETKSKLLHSEKMASLGVLVAGVTHEINNPINFVHAGTQNLNHKLNEFVTIQHIVIQKTEQFT